MNKILKNDEYENGDPYKVKNNIESEFQKRRIYFTKKLCLKAKKLLNTKEPKILDVGCGEGYITYEIKNLFEKADVFGIDKSGIAINKARSIFKEISFISCDAMNIPMQNEYFDIVICNNIIEHVDNPDGLLNEVSRKMKKGGYIIISTPSIYRIENVIKLFFFGKTDLMSELHFEEYSPWRIFELLKDCGYDVVYFMSKPLEYRTWNLKKIAIHKILKPILYFCFYPFNKMKYGLESTVFYLAKKNNK
ncbi:MAG: class I SAM-dependent methyltransferase [Parcubacteria group bacterium]|jgi:SAM-dependent methyltransferase